MKGIIKNKFFRSEFMFSIVLIPFIRPKISISSGGVPSCKKLIIMPSLGFRNSKSMLNSCGFILFITTLLFPEKWTFASKISWGSETLTLRGSFWDISLSPIASCPLLTIKIFALEKQDNNLLSYITLSLSTAFYSLNIVLFSIKNDSRFFLFVFK